MRFICFGAHPDDCEIGFGGTAALLANAGHAVKFVSATNGQSGHHILPPDRVASIRREEAAEAAGRLGIESTEVLDHPDGALLPTLEFRYEIIRGIRAWQADFVLTHRPWDYHADHRYTSQTVQDAAYLVQVPHVCPETPALRHNPVFLYLEDRFRLPVPFMPDVIVNIASSWDRKLAALDAHQSQFYEWLPWVDGEKAPETPAERRGWLERRYLLRSHQAGRESARAEAFQVCEYGRRPAPGELASIFPK